MTVLERSWGNEAVEQHENDYLRQLPEGEGHDVDTYQLRQYQNTKALLSRSQLLVKEIERDKG